MCCQRQNVQGKMEFLLEQQKETFRTTQTTIQLASFSTVFDSNLTTVIKKNQTLRG